LKKYVVLYNAWRTIKNSHGWWLYTVREGWLGYRLNLKMERPAHTRFPKPMGPVGKKTCQHLGFGFGMPRTAGGEKRFKHETAKARLQMLQTPVFV